ncbi:MAG: hypothetical protein AAB549_01650 [Patescibacteria group bacterium]
MKKYLLFALVIPAFFIANKTAQATTYVKKTDAVQNFTALVPSSWNVKAYEEGGQGFVATDRKNVNDNTSVAASTLSIVAYPFTPNERAVALANPKLFVTNFFVRMKSFF